MFEKQSTVDLKTETKPLILSNNPHNALVKEVMDALEIEDSIIKDAPFKKLETLGKLKTPFVIFLNEANITDIEKKAKVFKAFDGFEEDGVLLLESFNSDTLETLGEMILKALYSFDTYKTKKAKFGHLVYVGKQTEVFEKGLVIGEAINFTRDLVNRPYNKLNAAQLGEIAATFDRIENVEANILDKPAIEKLNMGAFLGVNKGSTDEPRLIHLTYKGAPNSSEMTTFVGKGIMYDTGGYSLKGVQSMPNMKMDMGGAATTLGAFKAIATLGLKTNISAVIPATDNRIGDDAIVPDDILTAANGTTIEIISTDAEGRLALCDALWYAQKEGATRIIDMATLTGAVVAALGDNIVGAFSNNDAFYQSFEKTVKASQEKVWRLPIDPIHHKNLESPFADIKNSGGRLAGSSIAAAFLEKFVDKNIPWIHLDIAGTAFEKEKGGTGVMVKSLTKLFD